MYLTELIKEVNIFFPEYLKPYSNQTNRTLHFMGATLFYVCVALALRTQGCYWLAIAIAIGYILPGIGHRYVQHHQNCSIRKLILCIL